MPDSTSMYRSATRAARACSCVLVAFAISTVPGCGTEAAREPTVPSVNFAPKLLLDVTDNGFTWRRGPNDDSSVTIPPDDGPPTVKIGTVLEVANTGRNEHWVDGDKTLNTGLMRPGEKATVVLSEELTEPKKVDIVDRQAPDHKTAINLVPRSTS